MNQKQDIFLPFVFAFIYFPSSNLKMYFMWKHVMHLVLFKSKLMNKQGNKKNIN